MRREYNARSRALYSLMLLFRKVLETPILRRKLNLLWDPCAYVLFPPYVYAVVKVSRILPDLRSGAQKFGYREIRSPINLNNAPDISAGFLRGPEIYRVPPPLILYFNHYVCALLSAPQCVAVQYSVTGIVLCHI